MAPSRPAALGLLGLGVLGALLCASAPGRVSAGSPQGDAFSKIKHVVFIVQENRSFNNLFYGYPGATTYKSGQCLQMKNGKTSPYTVPLRSQSLISSDISHGLQDAKTAYDKGAMNGFCNEFANGKPYSTYQYAYVPQKQIEPYWDMAKQYVLADHMFASQTDGSFVAHQYMIAGWAGGAYNYPAAAPWGCDSGTGNAGGVLNGAGQPVGIAFPCFTYKTIATELDAKKISWRTYSPSWPTPTSSPPDLGYYLNGYEASKAIRDGPDWTKDNIHPETKIIDDVESGELAAVTWVFPSFKLSDHAGPGSTDRGPSWVASVVNAIGASKFWDSTVIFVTWDDWGGWYDGMAPPQLDYDGLGMRVPLLCISPYAKTDYVDPKQYEFGSLLKFVEERFELSSLGKTDARAAAPADCFDLSQSPRKFQKIPATYSVRDVKAHVTDIPGDDE
jgi:phospholipase C